MLDDGVEEVIVYCVNLGLMLGLKELGVKVWLLLLNNLKCKLKYFWEVIEVDGVLVGINIVYFNKLVEEVF